MTDETTGVRLESLQAIVAEAGEAILAVYNRDFEVEHKADHTPVTEADMAAHRVIVKRLREFAPAIPVLSEEASHIPYAERRRWRRYWLVDPLDGTREFIKRNDEFTVNIALIEDRETVAGIVYTPVGGRCYYAARGRGAWRVDPGAAPRRIHTRAVAGPVRVAASRSHPSPVLQDFLDRLGEYERIPRGSSLKFCLVAEGAADVYPRFGKTSEWDTAAAQCVVEEAGGRVVDTAGKPLRYNAKAELLNPEFLVFGDPSRDWVGYLSASGA